MPEFFPALIEPISVGELLAVLKEKGMEEHLAPSMIHSTCLQDERWAFSKEISHGKQD